MATRPATITFLGAAREVTGSCYLVETGRARFLIDCGMFQGNRDAPEKNRAPFPFDPRHIDFVILSHAHIDHSGLLPKLCRHGFQGPIFMTAATRDLIEIMLADSAKIQESEAERTREAGEADSPDAVPLYTLRDAEAVLGHVHTVPYGEVRNADHTVRFRLRDAGHILGSAIVEIWLDDGGKALKLVFSGDLGQPDRAILRDPEKIGEADILLVES
ncbi:MAG: MBL fold metallo-hydrolase, partial [Hyphomicrobiales bacterium]|nr:MBL fold metallo-hydrolase [Hyphomicrobiales bacterium]